MKEKIIEILESHLRMMDLGNDCMEVITEDKFEKIAEDIERELSIMVVMPINTKTNGAN